jgi:hypothetical protein
MITSCEIISPPKAHLHCFPQKEICHALERCRAFFETGQAHPRTAPGFARRRRKAGCRERLTDRNGFGNAAALSKSRRNGFDDDGT